ncbi:maleylpyruvate isomerase [Enemella evansiae]|uniref:maleylpyruvate isomerase family mycothiol-dependent enzyme n=1 Tax=Enemella evansiae TaxID=2016499 RepID=UPI000B96E503|nr:maleylpyruvate isomerase family mycothiol-dependent enzyme [Enemella evansiae]OYO18483.1 maleylpyruvate isomerase [Enemella evansiae]
MRLDWTRDGTAAVTEALESLSEQDFQAPSGLPGWTRKHLVAHLAANADALTNLVAWARTGVETPMYSSTGQRNADIEAGGQRPGSELRDWFTDSAARLDTDWAALTEDQWQHAVRTAQGRTVPAGETVWMRNRELWVHLVDLDLDLGNGFNQAPIEFCSRLVTEIAAKRADQGPALELHSSDTGETWQVSGSGEPVRLTGTLAEMTAYLSGRGNPVGGPELPAWL